MAVVTTCATTPLTAALYPPWYQRKLESWKRGEIDWDSGAPLFDGASGTDSDPIAAQKLESVMVRSLLVYLRLDNMPTLLAFVSLLGGKPSALEERKHPSRAKESPQQETVPAPRRPVEVHGLRLVELTERTSTVMQVSEVEEYSIFDPVLNAFRVLGQLYNLAVSGEVLVVPESSYASTLVNKAVEESSDLLLLPWSETGSMSESQTISSASVLNKMASDSYSSFVTDLLNTAQCNTAVFINKGFSGSLQSRPSALKRSMSALSIRSHRDHASTMPIVDRSHHVFLPFTGGADGRVALRLVLQLAENPDVTATIVHIVDTMDQQQDDTVFFATMQKSLAADLQDRVVFDTTAISTPHEAIVERAQREVGANPKNGGDVVVVSRRKNTGGSCLGDAAEAIIANGIKASLLVVQSRGSGLD